MNLRRVILALLAAVHLIAGVSPVALGADAADETEHCSSDMTGHAGMDHSGDVVPADTMENCGHECRQCASCAMLPPAFVAAVVSLSTSDYEAIPADFRLSLRPDELLRPPIFF